MEAGVAGVVTHCDLVDGLDVVVNSKHQTIFAPICHYRHVPLLLRYVAEEAIQLHAPYSQPGGSGFLSWDLPELLR
jgi:hypothetical protein